MPICDEGRPDRLSVLVPCFNEERTIGALLQKLDDLRLPDVEKEVVVVDDGSTDDSAAIVRKFKPRTFALRFFSQPNAGKGAAVKKALELASGEVVVIQDADLEYDPADFAPMLSLLVEKEAEVVFGSRRLKLENGHSGIAFFWGAQTINLLFNWLYGRQVSDQFTCYKMVRKNLLDRILVSSDGFAYDGELVAKLFRLDAQIYEIPIHYHPRSRQSGKKIRWRDGLFWLWQGILYRFVPKERWLDET